MDCKSARILAGFTKPGNSELDPELRAEFDSHLSGCPLCREQFRSEQDFDLRVGRIIRDVPVPVGLKSRILDELAARRGAWYRRRIGIGVAAAASVFLAVSLVLVSEVAQPRQVRLDEVAQATIRAESDPQEEVRVWLASQSIDFAPAQPFNFALLSGYSLGRIQGRMVPMLRFRHPEKGVYARVYVLRSEDFDLKRLPDEPPAGEYLFQMAVLRDLHRPNRLAYIVVYNGDSLEPFLRLYPAT
jgi:hypothetical protein